MIKEGSTSGGFNGSEGPGEQQVMTGESKVGARGGGIGTSTGAYLA